MIPGVGYRRVVSDRVGLGARPSRDVDALDGFSVQCLLLLGFVPRPRTVFRGVELDDGYPAAERDRFGTHVPERPEPRREQATPGMLFDWLCEAVEQLVPDDAVLLLSSGKDSAALALACAELGRRVRCITFSGDGEDDEWAAARELTVHLGLQHERLAVPSVELDDARLAYFDECEEPVVDQAQWSYLWLADRVRGAPAVVDGMGNDFYFGHIPSAGQRWGVRVSLSAYLPALERWSFTEPAIRWTAGVPFRCTTSAHGLFNDVPRRFLRGSAFDDAGTFAEVLDWLRALDGHLAAQPPEARRALSRGYFLDTYSFMGKTVNLAKVADTRAVFPWADAGLQERIGALDPSLRFDLPNLKNKLLLRRLLVERSAPPGAKRGFTFPATRLLADNAALLRSAVGHDFPELGRPAAFDAARRRTPRGLQSLIQFALWRHRS